METKDKLHRLWKKRAETFIGKEATVFIPTKGSTRKGTITNANYSLHDGTVTCTIQSKKGGCRDIEERRLKNFKRPPLKTPYIKRLVRLRIKELKKKIALQWISRLSRCNRNGQYKRQVALLKWERILSHYLNEYNELRHTYVN
jgi:hypothetical protein